MRSGNLDWTWDLAAILSEKRPAMNNRLSLGAIFLLLCFPCLAQKKDSELPKVFTTSQYAFVETIYGSVYDTALDAQITPEDRQAVSRVEDALRTWGHYRLTIKRSDAELIFVVRKGRIVAAHGGVRVTRNPIPPPGEPPQRGTEAGPVAGAEVGPPYDLLFVYPKNQDGSLGGPAWKHTLNHGLDMPDLPLLKKFKEEVEAAFAKQAKKTP
jgi:hypothetical protein